MYLIDAETSTIPANPPKSSSLTGLKEILMPLIKRPSNERPMSKPEATLGHSFIIESNQIVLISINVTQSLGYPQYENSTNPPICLIGSSINLEIATAENGQRLLVSLNRTLASFQCALACLHEGDELIDLCLHICHIIRKLGLRVYDRHIHQSNYSSLIEELTHTDLLGIPYAIQVEKVSLKTGILKLRNRDSSLAETIHISDIETYLFGIFT
uniref:Anticodon-binding domain-containing protein n=1 Tax=Glossina palpalis gambiensis TaxID=67801 RepID=A0A1B0BZQ3_9MUSC